MQLGTHHEIEDLGGGRFRHTQHMRRIAYRQDGSLRRIVNDFIDSGDGTRPHMVSAAPFLLTIAPDGMRRIHPTRELGRYFEIGPPYIYTGGAWNKVNLGAATRTSNRLIWQTANADVSITMAGHYVKLDAELKNGWQPPTGRFAFPVGLTGLTRSGNQLLADGVPVMSFRVPHVYDAANPRDVRPITSDFVKVGSQWYALFTLPSLTGMSRPVVDPTLTLQPDATDGLDNTLRDVDPTSNRGALESLVVGNRSGVDVMRALIKFDLSALPSAAIISSAILSLYCYSDYAGASSTYAVYRQLRAWSETQSTWNVWSTDNNWGAAGGFDATDCEQTPIGSRNFTATETLDVFKDFTLTPTSKTALDLGNGWMIKSTTELADEYYFSSSDTATAANRPKLVVEYSLPSSGGLMTKMLFRGF